MIDTATETILTLTEAAKRLPRRRRGRKTHLSTLYRWTGPGCRGVILEHIQIGATRATSVEALQRFFVSFRQACKNRLPRARLGRKASGRWGAAWLSPGWIRLAGGAKRARWPRWVCRVLSAGV